jgi:starvation-inducible outer membrane lipoprotein
LNRRSLPLLVIVMALSLTACATIEPVKPWQKGNLARPDMAMDADILESKMAEHVYVSKESHFGGNGVGGGGCGCN